MESNDNKEINSAADSSKNTPIDPPKKSQLDSAEKKKIITDAFNFTDIYVDLQSLDKSYTYPNKKPLNMENKKIAALYKNFYKKIKEVLIEESHKKDHMIIFAGRYFRCYEIPTVDGSIVAARQMPPDFIDLASSGMTNRYIEELMSPRLRRGGLVIICGAPGNGKTTTCAATIDARLRQYGGLCITVEDPVEIKIQGERGKGMCLQIQVENQFAFPEAVRGIMRAYPTGTDSIMLIGETRDAETASEALRSSIDGRLVITTMHANSPIEAIQRFANIASKAMDSDDVNNMLSSSFRIAIHQQLVMKKLSTKILVDETDVQGAIRSGNFGGLKTQLESQATKINQSIRFDYMKRS